MELRHYWNIVWRRWQVVAALTLLVFVGSMIAFFVRPVSYTANARVQIELVPPQSPAAGVPNSDFFRYDDYYNYLATEYTMDDLVEVMNGGVFTDDVAATLQGPDFKVPIQADAIRGALDVSRKHRVLEISATSGQRDWAILVARAAIVTLQHDPVKYFSRGGSTAKIQAAALTIDQPLAAHSNRVRSLLNVALQTLIAFLAGLGLAFLLEYLDDRLRGAEMVRESLGLPVLAQLPATDGRRPGLPVRRAV